MTMKLTEFPILQLSHQGRCFAVDIRRPSIDYSASPFWCMGALFRVSYIAAARCQARDNGWTGLAQGIDDEKWLASFKSM
jgi:hypothetical protein